MKGKFQSIKAKKRNFSPFQEDFEKLFLDNIQLRKLSRNNEILKLLACYNLTNLVK